MQQLKESVLDMSLLLNVCIVNIFYGFPFHSLNGAFWQTEIQSTII